MIRFLEMRSINKSYAGVHALKNVDFALEKGEIHCLIGENGSGKSTLIKIICGVVATDAGSEIKIDGEKVENLTSKSALERGIHVIYQDLSLFPNLTAAENIFFNLYIEGGERLVRWSTVKKTASAVAKQIGVDINLGANVDSLSIADQQLVAICRSLIGDLKLLIMDEPTTSLTRKEVNALFEVIRKLKQKGITILFVSHKLNEILEVADRVTILRDGQNIGTLKSKEISHAKLVRLMTGREVPNTRLCQSLVSTKKLLEVNKLSKKGNFKDISFYLYEGEILGIIGLLGSGRTELALALIGMSPADEGSLAIDGERINVKSIRDGIQHGIGYVPEDRLTNGLIMQQSVADNLTITTLEQLLNRGGFVDRKKKTELVSTMIKDLGIKAPSVGSEIVALSGGNQQKVVLAKWISTSPKVLILDGPTVGIDIAAKTSIHEKIRDLASKGLGIILISDEAQEVLYNTHRVLIMRKGKIERELISAEITEEELLRAINLTDEISVGG